MINVDLRLAFEFCLVGVFLVLDFGMGAWVWALALRFLVVGDRFVLCVWMLGSLFLCTLILVVGCVWFCDHVCFCSFDYGLLLLCCFRLCGLFAVALDFEPCLI